MMRLFTIAAAVLVLGACAPALGGRAEDSALVLPLEVRNNYPTAVARDIYIAETGGSPRRVGQVPASATRRLDARAIDWDAEHVLIAESLYGGTIQSVPFFASPGGRVVWSLSANRIEVFEP